MLQYKLYIKNAVSRYLYIDLIISDVQSETLTLQLPSWRPGRYELGNFAKNIKKLDAFDANNNPLSYKKNTKDCWEINTNGSKQIKITYSYYAAELNAGSTYIDETQLYVNPCNCLLFVPSRMQQPHEVVVDIPDNYVLAASLKKEGKKLIAANFDELADSPFMASATIKTFPVKIDGLTFYLHFNGECNPTENQLVKDFSVFIKEQLSFFGSAHFKEYHFLFQILPVKFHHGVEHTENTVIAFGPGYHLMNADVYHEFLGLSCHEFFHTWNIKTIRPTEMFPYNYTKENYARTGFVYEGVTTYYGDKLLYTSKLFNDDVYFKAFEERMTKHLHSFGRYNLSVGDSSFDNWLDGYTPGAPYRKTNIYDEGCMIAFMLDVIILKNSQHKNSLQTVLKNLYDNFYKKQKGYTEQDFTNLCSEAAGINLQEFFNDYVYGLKPYEPMLHNCFNDIGLHLEKIHAPTVYERYLGFKAMDVNHHKKVTMLTPYSPAWNAGIAINDEIMAVNNFSLKADFNHWLNYFQLKDGKCELTVLSNNQLKQISISLKTEGDYFYTYKICKQQNISAEQEANFNFWKKSFQ